MSGINRRFLPQAIVTFILSLPAIYIYYEGYSSMLLIYFIGLTYVLINAVSNLRVSFLEPAKHKNINISFPKIGLMVNKPGINEDVKGALDLVYWLIAGTLLVALLPSFRTMASTIATNGTVGEVALSALIPFIIIAAFVFMVVKGSGLGKKG